MKAGIIWNYGDPSNRRNKSFPLSKWYEANGLAFDVDGNLMSCEGMQTLENTRT